MSSGWEIKTLGDFFDITSSKRVFKSEWKREGVPFYRAREIVKLSQNGYVNNELFISDEMYDDYSRKYGIPRPDDLMVTGVGTLGICYTVKENDKFYFKDGNIIWLKKRGEINSKYVEYAFKSDLLRNQIDNSIGATVGTYTIEKAKNTIIHVPPLSEQQRIVALLDQASAAIDTAIDNTEKNLKNARELFQTYLANIVQSMGNKWERKTLGEVFVIERGGSPRPIKKFLTNSPNGINWIKIGDTKEGGKYIFSTKEKITSEGVRHSRMVHEGDFLLSNSMSFGRPYIMRTEGCIHDGWLVLREKTKTINQDYLYYLLSSRFVFSQFDKLAAGSTVRNLNIDLVKSVSIPIPTIPEQQQLVQKLDLISSETKILEENYQQKLVTLEELKRAILQKAFNGELT